MRIETAASDSKNCDCDDFGPKISSSIHDIGTPMLDGGDSGHENVQINEPIAYNNLRVYVAAEKLVSCL